MPPEELTPAERERIIRDLKRLTQLMDASFQLPGTGFRFGLDPVLGLLPGVGDAVSLAISSYIILQARRLGISKWKLARMMGNVGVDAMVGAIPLVGDVFDFAFKANRRNLKLLNLSPDVIEVKATPK